MISSSPRENANVSDVTGRLSEPVVRVHGRLALGLLAVLLLGSVLIPARLTWRVGSLLRENREIIEPARLLISQLEEGIAVETGALREYRITGDLAQLAVYQSAAVDDAARIGELDRLSRVLGEPAVAGVATLKRQMAASRQFNAQAPMQARLRSELARMDAAHDSTLRALSELAGYLRSEAVDRQQRVGASETLSLLVNASLVLLALVAIGVVARLIRREGRLLKAARENRAELHRVMKSRSGLMRGFSHDVKNPLGAADGYAALLTDDVYGPLTTQQKGIVERVRRSIRGALGLIDQLQTIARAETGHLELALEPVDVCELVRATGEEYDATARNHGLALSVDVACDAAIVEADPARAHQILANLVSNAIKYTAQGSVIIRARQYVSGRVPGGRPCAAIEVIDTGPGIPPDRQDHIFHEFVRLAGEDKPGAGLGLAISLRLAHALGGDITVQSEPGRGSTFTLWLPLLSQANRQASFAAAYPGAQPLAMRVHAATH